MSSVTESNIRFGANQATITNSTCKLNDNSASDLNEANQPGASEHRQPVAVKNGEKGVVDNIEGKASEENDGNIFDVNGCATSEVEEHGENQIDSTQEQLMEVDAGSAKPRPSLKTVSLVSFRMH